MELLTADRQLREIDGFPQHVDPFPQTNGCDLVYDQHQPTAVIHPLEDHIASLVATNPSPPQKLRPIRFSGRMEDPPPPFPDDSAALAGTLDRLPDLGFGGGNVVQCFHGQVKPLVGDMADAGGGGSDAVDLERVGSETSEENRGGSVNSLGNMSVSKFDNRGHLQKVIKKRHQKLKEPVNRKRKRETRKKLEVFLEQLVEKVMERQEQMHKQLIETMERRENERIMREEAWRQKEIERMRRDEEARAQETARSLALISFIQSTVGHEIEIPQQPLSTIFCTEDNGIQKEIKCDPSNRRWPDAEVQALIMLRTAMEHKFRTTGVSKCSIWDEISAGMTNMGYTRSAKKCKEKWENINKYFRKSIGNGKKHHPEKSKACPYFQELDILYKNGLLSPGNSLVSGGNESETKREN
ncbi:trihelix transcription factor GTL1 [Carica papaya]|uniref:trihelix transcription factor GTL1 n=1 Tax=Carica papaya TaxID=3649 RepID=UPI000B8CDE9C|nr:trihelix transcription factor GTL1 [Carica papaya]